MTATKEKLFSLRRILKGFTFTFVSNYFIPLQCVGHFMLGLQLVRFHLEGTRLFKAFGL